MGLDVYLVAVRDMGGKFEEMLKINQFCGDHNVSSPVEVAEYFGHLVGEDERYIRSEMAEIVLASARGAWDAEQTAIPIEIGSADGQAWASVNLGDIPDDIRALKVIMSW